MSSGSNDVIAIGTSHQSDPFFRYRRPVVAVRPLNKEKFCIVTNLHIVARHCCRPVAHLAAFVRRELYAQGIRVKPFDQARRELVIKTAISAGDVDDIVTKFCDLHLLCRRCDLPETRLALPSTTGSAVMKITCQACGHVKQWDYTADCQSPEEKAFHADILRILQEQEQAWEEEEDMGKIREPMIRGLSSSTLLALDASGPTLGGDDESASDAEVNVKKSSASSSRADSEEDASSSSGSGKGFW